MAKLLPLQILDVIKDFRSAHGTRCPEVVSVPFSRERELLTFAKPGNIYGLEMVMGEDGWITHMRGIGITYHATKAGHKEKLLAYDYPKVERELE